MTETYSLALTGQRADSDFAVATLKVGDSVGAGSHNYVMQQRTQILCKNPDGSQSFYTVDAERSTDSNIVMKAV